MSLDRDIRRCSGNPGHLPRCPLPRVPLELQSCQQRDRPEGYAFLEHTSDTDGSGACPNAGRQELRVLQVEISKQDVSGLVYQFGKIWFMVDINPSVYLMPKLHYPILCDARISSIDRSFAEIDAFSTENLSPFPSRPFLRDSRFTFLEVFFDGT